MALTCELGQHSSTKSPDFVRVRSSYGHLDVSFRRTVRVADNKNAHWLPPDLGPHPLYQVNRYPRLCKSIAAANGIFLPVHELEAMILHFRSTDPFAIKVFVGGVNAMKMHTESEATDWIEVDGEEDVYLDGFAIDNKLARQFVTVPAGSKASFATQLTKKDDQSIRLVVFPLKMFKLDDAPFDVTVKTLTGKSLKLQVSADTTVLELQQMIQDKEGVPPDMQRLVFKGKQVNISPVRDKYTQLGRFGIVADDDIHLVLRLRGGGKNPEIPGAFIKNRHFLTVAPGGLIRYKPFRPKQMKDYYCYLWDDQNTITLQAHLLDVEAFQELTGKKPDIKPMDEKSYSQLGLPYFQHYKELQNHLLSTTEGRTTYAHLEQGRKVKSLGEKMDLHEPSQRIEAVELDEDIADPRAVEIPGMHRIMADLKALKLTEVPAQAPVSWNPFAAKPPWGEYPIPSDNGGRLGDDLSHSSQPQSLGSSTTTLNAAASFPNKPMPSAVAAGRAPAFNEARYTQRPPPNGAVDAWNSSRTHASAGAQDTSSRRTSRSTTRPAAVTSPADSSSIASGSTAVQGGGSSNVSIDLRRKSKDGKPPRSLFKSIRAKFSTS